MERGVVVFHRICEDTIADVIKHILQGERVRVEHITQGNPYTPYAQGTKNICAHTELERMYWDIVGVGRYPVVFWHGIQQLLGLSHHESCIGRYGLGELVYVSGFLGSEDWPRYRGTIKETLHAVRERVNGTQLHLWEHAHNPACVDAHTYITAVLETLER